MAYNAKKSEHNGGKHGCGSYYGPRRDAKRESDKLRREDAKKALRAAMEEIMDEILDVELEEESWYPVDSKQLVHPTGAKYGDTDLSKNCALLLVDGGVWCVLTSRDRMDGTGRNMDVTIGYPDEASARAAFEACK